MNDERYAEGNREADSCQKCGQPIWRVYHGPNRNHTIEPRPEAAGTLREAVETVVPLLSKHKPSEQERER